MVQQLFDKEIECQSLRQDYKKMGRQLLCIFEGLCQTDRCIPTQLDVRVLNAEEQLWAGSYTTLPDDTKNHETPLQGALTTNLK